jgi:hypothetical protein
MSYYLTHLVKSNHVLPFIVGSSTICTLEKTVESGRSGLGKQTVEYTVFLYIAGSNSPCQVLNFA